jgi:hypothetical protein
LTREILIERQLTSNGKVINYFCRRSRKANRLQIRITPKKTLELIIPIGYSFSEAERFLLSKTPWIEKHLQIINISKNRFYYLGNEIKIRFFYDLFPDKLKIKYVNGNLILSGKEQNEEIIKNGYYTFLKHSAKKYLISRIKKIGEQNQFTFNRITLRNQSTRWGSCSKRGNISLNYKLMKLKKDLIDYVLVHELCHTRHPNHSKNFWNEVEKFLPNYKLLKKELKRYSTL